MAGQPDRCRLRARGAVALEPSGRRASRCLDPRSHGAAHLTGSAQGSRRCFGADPAGGLPRPLGPDPHRTGCVTQAGTRAIPAVIQRSADSDRCGGRQWFCDSAASPSSTSVPSVNRRRTRWPGLQRSAWQHARQRRRSKPGTVPGPKPRHGRRPQSAIQHLRSVRRTAVRPTDDHAAIEGLALRRRIVADRVGFAVTSRRQLPGCDAECDEVIERRLRPPLRQLEIVGLVTGAVGVAADLAALERQRP